MDESECDEDIFGEYMASRLREEIVEKKSKLI